MQTYSAKPKDIQQDWFLIDAGGKTIGRLATEIAHRLRGKHKPTYTPHMDTGDFIVVINASNMKATGNKLANKNYYHHSGYPGGIKSKTLGELMQTSPEQVLEHAVKGMLPRGPLGRAMFSKLKVYAGSEHPHQAQTPKILKIGEK